jgi:thiol-disulfide isomerase/thioredoxin
MTMKALPLFALICLLSTHAWAQELNWPELVRRPEFWPAQCTIKTAKEFQRGKVAAGQKLDVLALTASQIELASADGLNFVTKPDDTDALAVARIGWSKLTPAKRELTYASLLKRPELWPYRVKLTRQVELNTGPLKAGEPMILKAAEGDQLLVVIEKQNMLLNVPPQHTDLLAQAYRRLEKNDALPGRVTEELLGKLINPVTGAAAPLEPNARPRYFVFYRGAAWCGPCRQFSPSLVKLYNEQKAKHPEAEFIYFSADKSAAEMRGYAQEAGFSWPAVAANRQRELQIVTPLFGKFIDAQGNVLIDSARMDRLVALKQLEALLNKQS